MPFGARDECACQSNSTCGGSEMRGKRTEAMSFRVHNVGGAIVSLLQQGEGAQTMLLWVQEKSKDSTLLTRGCDQKNYFSMWGYHPKMLESSICFAYNSIPY